MSLKPSRKILESSHEISAFCGGVASIERRCTGCLLGYGSDDMHAPPPAEPTWGDGPVCHDRSGQYTKHDSLAGNPPLDPVKDTANTLTGAPLHAVATM
ncbi:hypothetical protein [Rhodobacter lacus]|uniref:Uncharacterized protein n=1 Tax=Rhodobacter lacus TaxID=1641972 RepID=A0ABW5AD04_9RHOB